MKALLSNKRFWIGAGAVAVVVFLVMQFFPMDKTNPPVVQEPVWDSPQTRELAQAACFDCHSNESVFPWYASVAPMRLLVLDHVNEGRSKMNFSEWDNSVPMDEIEEVIREGEMPPWDYKLMHPNARLTDAEKDQLVAGLRQSIINSGGTAQSAGGGDDDDDGD